MKFLKVFKDRRGVAMETSIVFLLSVFSLCALLTVLALTGSAQMNIENSMISTRAAVEQIGENYLHFLKTNEAFPPTAEGYSAEIVGGILRVRNDKGTVLLYVDAEVEADGELTVNKWCYQEPVQ